MPILGSNLKFTLCFISIIDINEVVIVIQLSCWN